MSMTLLAILVALYVIVGLLWAVLIADLDGPVDAVGEFLFWPISVLFLCVLSLGQGLMWLNDRLCR